MWSPITKIPILLFFLILIISLCNIPVVFATDVSSAPASTISPENEAPLRTISDEEMTAGMDSTEQRQAETTPPDTAATADELLAWLDAHQRTEGTVRLTSDIFLDNLSYVRISKVPITIDTGEFSIIAAGCVELYISGLTICGYGGEDGVLRAAKGGDLFISYLTIVADAGYTVVQEEGAGFVLDSVVLAEGSILYANTPFICYWDPVLILVEPGQIASEVLPASVPANVRRLGGIHYEEVPVNWELSGHEAYEEQRLRFTFNSTVTGFAFEEALTCTVVYNDFPFTFTEVTANESRTYYDIGANFTKPEVTFPITISQEYSFDGETWAEMDESQIWNYTGLDFIFSKIEDDDAVIWDTVRNPWLYIRIHWRDGEVHHFSNVLRFSGVDFGAAEDIGGNRGGGTDIIAPPTVEKPELPAPPDPSPKPPAGITKVPTPSSPPVMVEIPDAGQTVPLEKAVTNTPATQPASAAQTALPQTPSPQTALPQTGNEAHKPFAKALPIVVGCTATAALIGAAAIYQSPSLRKRVFAILKKLLPAKKPT